MEEMLFDRSLIEDKIDGKKFVFPPNVHLCEMYIASRKLKALTRRLKNVKKRTESNMPICKRKQSLWHLPRVCSF